MQSPAEKWGECRVIQPNCPPTRSLGSVNLSNVTLFVMYVKQIGAVGLDFTIVCVTNATSVPQTNLHPILMNQKVKEQQSPTYRGQRPCPWKSRLHRDYRQKFLERFSGSGHMSNAFAEKGVPVQSVDLIHGDHCDLTKSSVQQRILDCIN